LCDDVWVVPKPDQINGQDRLTVEIGCGRPERRKADRPGSTIGLDIDPFVLRRPETSVDRPRSVCADAKHLPFRSASCHLLILEAVLHHLTPIDDTLRELTRVLHPTGLIQITDGVALPADEASTLDRELLAAGHAGEPMYGFDLGELASALRRCGLKVDRVHVDGTATFATPPAVSRVYSSERFTLIGRHG